MNPVCLSHEVSILNVNVVLEQVDPKPDIPVLCRHDGTLDEIAYTSYDEFEINTYAVFSSHEFDLIDEKRPNDNQMQYTFVSADYASMNCMYVVRINVTDWQTQIEFQHTHKEQYTEHPVVHEEFVGNAKICWRLKEITINNDIYFSYEDALDALDKRLD